MTLEDKVHAFRLHLFRRAQDGRGPSHVAIRERASKPSDPALVHSGNPALRRPSSQFPMKAGAAMAKTLLKVSVENSGFRLNIS